MSARIRFSSRITIRSSSPHRDGTLSKTPLELVGRPSPTLGCGTSSSRPCWRPASARPDSGSGRDYHAARESVQRGAGRLLELGRHIEDFRQATRWPTPATGTPSLPRPYDQPHRRGPRARRSPSRPPSSGRRDRAAVPAPRRLVLGEVVAIYGLGLVGPSVRPAAKAAAASSSDRHPDSRNQLAESCGADLVAQPATSDLIAGSWTSRKARCGRDHHLCRLQVDTRSSTRRWRSRASRAGRHRRLLNLDIHPKTFSTRRSISAIRRVWAGELSRRGYEKGRLDYPIRLCAVTERAEPGRGDPAHRSRRSQAGAAHRRHLHVERSHDAFEAIQNGTLPMRGRAHSRTTPRAPRTGAVLWSSARVSADLRGRRISIVGVGNHVLGSTCRTCAGWPSRIRALVSGEPAERIDGRRQGRRGIADHGSGGRAGR